MDKDETTLEHQQNKYAETFKLESDRSDTHPRTGGLFQGCFKKVVPFARPIDDGEDGVQRCPRCTWELQDGVCEHCGLYDTEYIASDPETDYGSPLEIQDLDETDSDGGREEQNGFTPEPLAEIAYSGIYAFPRYRFSRSLVPNQSPASAITVESDDGDDDQSELAEDSEMDDFIVDDNWGETDQSTVVGNSSYVSDASDHETGTEHSNAEEYPQNTYDDSDDSDEPVRPPQRRQLTRHQVRPPSSTISRQQHGITSTRAIDPARNDGPWPYSVETFSVQITTNQHVHSGGTGLDGLRPPRQSRRRPRGPRSRRRPSQRRSRNRRRRSGDC